MSDAPQIARLKEVDIRAAWPHEALNFTPWLYANLDALGDAIGIPLDGEGSEVAVESFSADILATNRYDGTRVLIENQLECSDHSHLGQIMTYLAGLDAKTIIWVASEFRDAHLSAINWLNENTGDSVSFFAVKLKVVQIAGSPLAPIFDVVARPNNWERLLHATTQTASRSELSERRFRFWTAFVDRIPGELERGGPANYWSNRWHKVDQPAAIVSMYAAAKDVGLFIRAPENDVSGDFRERLAEKSDEISNRLGVPMTSDAKYFFGDRKLGDYNDPTQRDGLIDWLNERATLYERTLREVFVDGTAEPQ